jgi:hypothetical protein
MNPTNPTNPTNSTNSTNSRNHPNGPINELAIAKPMLSNYFTRTNPDAYNTFQAATAKKTESALCVL